MENGVARPGQSVDGGRTVDPSASAADPMFWWAGLREPALSQAACEAALDDGGRVFLELNGSAFYCEHPVGDEMARRRLLEPASGGGGGACGVALCTMRAPAAEVAAEAQLLAALCRLWCAGARVDWAVLGVALRGEGEGVPAPAGL